MARSYGFSRTPAREAVRKLADEGLIEVFPQSGTFAARIPLGALPETIVIRKALEETSARLAAERSSRSQIIALLAQLERQREASRAGDRDAFHRADEAFHCAVSEAAGYRGIWTLVEQIKVHVDRYRHLTLPQEGRMARAIREHAAIAAAINPATARAPPRRWAFISTGFWPTSRAFAVSIPTILPTMSGRGNHRSMAAKHGRALRGPSGRKAMRSLRGSLLNPSSIAHRTPSRGRVECRRAATMRFRGR